MLATGVPSTMGDPRVGSTKTVAGSEVPFDVDKSGQDLDSLGEFGPGESAGGAHVERRGDASGPGRQCVDGLDDVGVVEVAAGGFVVV